MSMTGRLVALEGGAYGFEVLADGVVREVQHYKPEVAGFQAMTEAEAEHELYRRLNPIQVTASKHAFLADGADVAVLTALLPDRAAPDATVTFRVLEAEAQACTEVVASERQAVLELVTTDPGLYTVCVECAPWHGAVVVVEAVTADE
jgi:hypothetical protein